MPAARATIYSAMIDSGSTTSWTQRGTTTRRGVRRRRPGQAARLGSSTSTAASVGHSAPRAAEYAPCQRARDHPVRRRRGRRPRPAHAARRCCPRCASATRPTFVVVNGENIAGGLGITPKLADELFAAGVDVDHARQPHLPPARDLPLPRRPRGILRPANYLRSQPGHGSCVVERDGVRLGVVNLSGNVFLQRRARRRSWRSTPSLERARGQGRPRARRLPRRGHEREGRAWAGTSTGA